MELSYSTLLFMNLSTGEIIIIVFAILLLFGGRKIPELMKGLGKGVRSFKQGMTEIQDEINTPVEEQKKQKEEEDKK